jgi:hypothetical protein
MRWEILAWGLTKEEDDEKERSSVPDLEIMDAVPDVSEKRLDMDWSGPDIAILFGTAWSGTEAKERELSKVHAVDCGHVIWLRRLNDGIDAAVTWLALMAAPDSEKKDVSDDAEVAKAALVGTYVKEWPWLSSGSGSEGTAVA